MAGKGGVLTGLDLSLKLTPNQEAARLATAQDRLLHLRLVLGGQIGDNPQLGPPVCVVFEGWDASGKVVRSNGSSRRWTRGTSGSPNSARPAMTRNATTS